MARAHGAARRGGGERERAAAAAMRGAGDVVAADFERHRNVDIRLRAYDAGRHAQVPVLGGAVHFGDLRTGARGAAAVEHAGSHAAARDIGVVLPPDHRVATLLVELALAAGDREAIVDRILARGDERDRAVPDGPAGLLVVLGEPEVNHRLHEVARLRRTLHDGPLDPPGHWVVAVVGGGSGIVGLLSPA